VNSRLTSLNTLARLLVLNVKANSAAALSPDEDAGVQVSGNSLLSGWS
jgi:hypothetical protein